MEVLSRARVAVFGLGGVGGYVVEALARSGVGAFVLTDKDRVSVSNINRQILATQKTVGRLKTDVALARVRAINPMAEVTVHPCFFSAETASQFDFSSYDYVVDAIDTVTDKIELVLRAQQAGTPIICSMGAGNKFDPTAFTVADIYQTSVCPLARVMRRELKKRGVNALKVVYSAEPPVKPEPEVFTEPEGEFAKGRGQTRRAVPGSMATVPAAAGLILAGEVLRDLVVCGHG